MEINGENLAAAIVCESDFAGTDAIAEFLSGELEIYKQSEKYLLFNEFSPNERGKINVILIKEMAESFIPFH